MSKQFRPNMPVLLHILAAPLTRVGAQSGKPITSQDALLRTMESLDSAVFAAYNRCDLEKHHEIMDPRFISPISACTAVVASSCRGPR
jgi:hypothetical protein